MEQKTSEFVQGWVAKYYKQNEVTPREVGAREVGYGTFEQKIAVRHLMFKNNMEFNQFLREKAPVYVSASSAYYEKPDARPMANKVWLGADLVFDIDLHPAEWDPEGKFAQYHLIMHPIAFEKAKSMAIALVEKFLVPDFGFSDKEISVNFSGSRGYHVRVYSDRIRKMTAKERREIVDYIGGRGILFEQMFKEDVIPGRKIKVLKGPAPQDPGWGGRIAKLMISLNPGHSLLPKELKNADKLERFKEGVMHGEWDRVSITKKEEVWRRLVEYGAVAIGEPTDVNVTVDTTKILRVPNTIHGGSSLIAKEFPYGDIGKFDPLKHAVAFGNEQVEVEAVKEVPSFEFNGQSHSGFSGRSVVPLNFALYLMCKGYVKL